MLFLIGVVSLNLYAVALILLRTAVYRTALYRPMLWNIWLSIMPVLILVIGFIAGAVLLQFHPAPPVVPVFWGLVGVVWLLMLPNASYLITELNLSHRQESDPVPLWYDIILVISLAMSGVVNTVVNVLLVHLFVALSVFGDSLSALTRPASWIAVGCVLLLLGFGMYLGRYLRLNSWDLRHPVGLLRKVGTHFRSWDRIWACLGFTVTYALFLGIFYLIIAGLVIDTLSAFAAFRASL